MLNKLKKYFLIEKLRSLSWNLNLFIILLNLWILSILSVCMRKWPLLSCVDIFTFPWPTNEKLLSQFIFYFTTGNKTHLVMWSQHNNNSIYPYFPVVLCVVSDTCECIQIYILHFNRVMSAWGCLRRWLDIRSAAVLWLFLNLYVQFSFFVVLNGVHWIGG